MFDGESHSDIKCHMLKCWYEVQYTQCFKHWPEPPFYVLGKTLTLIVPFFRSGL